MTTSPAPCGIADRASARRRTPHMSATGSQWNASSVSVARRGAACCPTGTRADRAVPWSNRSPCNRPYEPKRTETVLHRASSFAMDDDVDPGPTGRLLALLSLLPARPQWSGPELAERLGPTNRTPRGDVGRLRRLGYPVLAAVGTLGGYRLGAGGRAMPPLMLDRDEALAVAVCLRSTAT